MSIAVKGSNDHIVRKFATAGVVAGTAVALHKSGVLKTQAADQFVKTVGTAIKNGDKQTLKNSAKTVYEGAKSVGTKAVTELKEFMGKSMADKGSIVKGKLNGLWTNAKELAQKITTGIKDFASKDFAAQKETLKTVAKSPAAKWAAGIIAGSIALGLIVKAIKNHKANS